ELQGDLFFAGAESAVRAIADGATGAEIVVLDVRRVDEVTDVARRMLKTLRTDLSASGRLSVLVDPDRTLLGAQGAAETVPTFRTCDGAVEWAEDRLLSNHGAGSLAQPRVDVADHRLTVEMGSRAMAVIEPMLQRCYFDDRQTIVSEGAPAVGLHLLIAGQVASYITGPSGERLRLTVLSAGTTFGEYA